MLHNQHSRVDNSFRGSSPGKCINVVAVALSICLMMGFFEDLRAASISPQTLNEVPTPDTLTAVEVETHTNAFVQTPGGFHYRRKRAEGDAACPALEALFKNTVPEAQAKAGMKVVDLTDARFAGVCRMAFKIHTSDRGATVPIIFDAGCTCAFYAKNAAVAAAHCFKEATTKAKAGFTVVVVPTYKKGDDAGNTAREMGVIDWWYPKAFQQPVNKAGKTVTQHPASGHDIVFFRTDKEVAETAVYKFATPEQVREYHNAGSVISVGYPKAYESGQVAVQIQGKIRPLDGELTNQLALQDEKQKSCMSQGGSGGPWFVSQDALDFGDKTKGNDKETAERKKWILGINDWVGALTPITVGPIITKAYVDIGKAVAEGKGEQHKTTGVYGKVAEHKP